jgi:hypothetical protein
LDITILEEQATFLTTRIRQLEINQAITDDVSSYRLKSRTAVHALSRDIKTRTAIAISAFVMEK